MPFVNLRSIGLCLLGCCLFACRPAVEPAAPLFSKKVSFNDPAEQTFALSLPANTPVWVRVERRGAEIETLALQNDDAVISRVRLPYLRHGIEYHWLEPAALKRTLRFRLRPLHAFPKSSVLVTAYPLADGSRAARQLAEAYRLYAGATQAEASEAPGLWGPRVQQLERAAAIFARLQRTEEQLWAEYLAAYFTYFPLYRFQQAAVKARKVRVRAGGGDWPVIELMAIQLEAQALLEPDDERSHEDTLAGAALAQQLLEQASGTAANLGMPFEQAWAINNRGIGYFYQGQYGLALTQYERAQHMAIDLQDDYLVRLIGGNVALTRASLGELDGALDELLAIQAILEEHGSPSEQAHNLAEIGRLYRSLFMFPEAVEALAEAMQLSSVVGTPEGTGRIGLDLAKTYFAMGQPERATQILPQAIEDMRRASHRQGLYEAHGLQGAIGRMLGHHETVGAHRDKQQKFISNNRDRARFNYQQGMDAAARGDLPGAAERFAASHAAAIHSGNEALGLAARLKFCAHSEKRSSGGVDCAIETLETDLGLWLPHATPSRALDAQFTLARIQAQQGRSEDALQSTEVVLEQIMLHRARLPGVLGAWYWESRAHVITAYLDLMLESNVSPDKTLQVLMTLDQLRNMEVAQPGVGREGAPRQAARDRELRLLYARFVQEEDAAGRGELRRQIDRLLMTQEDTPDITHLSIDLIAAELDTLPVGVAYLTYYFSDREIWAWLGTRQGLSLVNLGAAEPARALIKRINEDLRVVGDTALESALEALGDRLLGPLGPLPEILLLGVTGELASLPFEALRLNGRYLALDYQVVHLLSLRGLSSFRAKAGLVDDWRSVWLAGAPVASGQGISSLPAARQELADLGRMFAGLEVRTIEGGELRRERFFEAEFAMADLVHIASHATLDFQYPGFSTIELSSRAGETGHLTPLDVRRLHIAADLVTLSACEGTGLNDFRFDSHLGFVPEFLHAGAGAVIASLWPVSDRETQAFMVEFYRRLLAGEDIPVALVTTKRALIRDHGRTAPASWAAFQLYLQ